MNSRGISLVELLMVIIISSIAFIAISIPFISERSLTAIAQRQTEAQRDAQMITRSIARVAHDSSNYVAAPGVVGLTQNSQITFTTSGVGGCQITFQGGPGFNAGQLQRVDQCTASTALLIDAIRSRVLEFTPTQINSKLFKIKLNVAHRNTATWANEPTRNEIVETQIFLRNG